MKQKRLFLGAAVALSFLFSASAIAQPRNTKKKVKKVVEAKVDVCPFSDTWVENETKFEDRKEKAHATFVPYSSTASMQQDDYFKFPWLTPKQANYLLLNGKWKFHYTDDGNTWALGAQYWSENKPADYNPRYGILLDMVGGQGAKFYREGMSMQYAGGIVKRVWAAARQAGFGSFFPKSDGGMITDDHIPVNEKAKIPTIDVIAYYPDCQQSSFGPTWHTVSDDMTHLDKNVLKAVGQTVIQVLYTEE